MKPGVVASSVFHPEDLAQFAMPPAWRKATRNMVMAVRSMESALLKAPTVLELGRARVGLVVGTNSGEIETSAEFISTLARTKMARPLLFQNSLHNATTGFAAIHFGLTGPAFTISDGHRTPGEALNLASMMIEEGLCTSAVVTLVEVHRVMADHIGVTVGEGACTLVLAGEDFVRESGVKPSVLEAEAFEPYRPEPNCSPLFDIGRSGFYREALRLGEKRP